MNTVGSCTFGLSYLFTQACEVCGENRRRQFHVPHLRASPMLRVYAARIDPDSNLSVICHSEELSEHVPLRANGRNDGPMIEPRKADRVHPLPSLGSAVPSLASA